MTIGEVAKKTNLPESTLRYQGRGTMPKRLEILQRHREYVLEQQKKWQEYLQNLDDKIAFYQKSI